MFLILLAVLGSRWTCWLPCLLTTWWMRRKIISIFILFCRNLHTLRIPICIYGIHRRKASDIFCLLTWFFPLINKKGNQNLQLPLSFHYHRKANFFLLFASFLYTFSFFSSICLPSFTSSLPFLSCTSYTQWLVGGHCLM